MKQKIYMYVIDCSTVLDLDLESLHVMRVRLSLFVGT